MREIKFRVWCKDHNEWEKDPIFISLDGIIFHAHRFPPMPIRPDNHIFMQYTGLKDKNGKEIYEGDIIRFDTSETTQEVGLIDWGENRDNGVGCGFTVKYKQRGRVDLIGWLWAGMTIPEIIGNIYENKELIESGLQPNSTLPI